jgi:indolepyruvate ferredoxin oxidoreductase
MTHEATGPVGVPTPDLAEVSLGDKYDLSKRRVFLSGAQAIVRLLMLQKERDRRAGLNTGGFVSGYRGSPLGGLDLQFFRAKKELDANDIVFQPGLNEELAATAVWGSQQAEMRGEGKYDGVFAIWYGKGPGVDRSGDALRHANLAGTSEHGGALLLMGDDHTAESSTTAHQSEFHLLDIMIPILSPAGIQELLDYGQHGWALSRYAGVWVGLKCVKEVIESTASVDGSMDRVAPIMPADHPLPVGGLNIRRQDPFLAQEARLQDHKRDAIVAYIRTNKLNDIVMSGGPSARIGVITLGKSYLDVRQAFDDLDIDEARANKLGIRLYKLGCAWPIEPDGLRAFAQGLEMIIVVEEKRSLVEVQVREELYGVANPPVVVGKRDEKGEWLFPVKASLDTNDIAVAIGERISRFHPQDTAIADNVSRLRQVQTMLAQASEVARRSPHFCSGCPHNTSTRVPYGMRAGAGIGCHTMALWMDRNTEGLTQMGGEGANWVGEARFSKRGHIFQNLGDGTYNHSGILAIRFAIASGVNITYKILFNDAVAMTGGQAHEGGLTVDRIARQVAAEGVKRIALVTDEPDKYPPGMEWPSGMTIHHRDDLDAVQRELADIPGTTTLIYDQTCAAEKRRRRKRGSFPDPDKRVIINELVCEGCGDCGVQSNCVSVQPIDTEFGRKRTIDQSNCNKDFSCVNGFCPSFVTVHGAKLKKPRPAKIDGDTREWNLPAPRTPALGEHPFEILVDGIGGTGVVTIGAIITMAAHLEGKGCGAIDMAGIAQKGGAVFSHVKIARTPDDIHAIRVAAGEADLVLGCDLVVSGQKNVLAAAKLNHTGFIVNTAEIYPGDFTRDADFRLPTERIKKAIREAAGDEARFVDATGAATALLGNSLGANMFMLGYAWQGGFVPLSEDAIMRALELNGEAVEMNKNAFIWGRRACAEPDAVNEIVARARPASSAPDVAETLDEIVARRVAFLTNYQNAAYAERYRARVVGIAKAEREKTPDKMGLADAVARYLFKLMAIKDEYEVARLYTDGSFARQLATTFDGDVRLEFHLAPPILVRKDASGLPRKTSFGPWMMKAFGVLAGLRKLRGTPLDVFGYFAERKGERRLLADYEALLTEIVAKLDADNHSSAVALASIPEKIRGYGHVKERSIKVAKGEETAFLQAFRDGKPTPTKLAAE